MKINLFFRALLIALLSSFIQPDSYSQVKTEWLRTYNGTSNGSDEVQAMAVDGLSNVIVTGRSLSTGNTYNIATIKYSGSGVQQWIALYNGQGNAFDEPGAIAIDDSNNVYVAGRTQLTSSNYDIVVLKYNTLGVLQWTYIWGGQQNLNDYPNSICVDASGNVYVAGSTVVSGNDYDYVTLKITPAGSLGWSRIYGNPANSFDEALYVAAGPSGSVYVSGNSVASGTGQDFYTIKYSSSGDTVWTRRYSGNFNTENDVLKGFKIDNSGNAFLTGSSRTGSSGTDYITIKYNSSGTAQWRAVYTSPGSEQDIPEGLEIDSQGFVYVTGSSRPTGDYNDFATLKYSPSGNQEWLSIYNNNSANLDDSGYDIVVDDQSSVYVAGSSKSNGINSDPVVVKYSSSGSEMWLARYDSTEDEEVHNIALDQNRNLYISGFINVLNQDFLTIKYSQSVGISQISAQAPAEFTLEQNYPNPFNPITAISFSIPHRASVNLEVYNSSGMRVEQLVNQELGAGRYRVNWDAAGKSSGIYFCRLISGGTIETVKMNLIK